MMARLFHPCRRLAAALLLILPLTCGCAQRNQLEPVQTNVWLVSESREQAIGEQVVKEVEREYAVYQDPELTAYIDELGQKLAAASDRPNIPYTFKVLDAPIANAFACPGGFIYITRGLLGILTDEAELAGVIGHEIGHVAARHSAKRIQAGTITSVLLVGIAIAAGDRVDDDMLRAVDIAATLVFLGYSRGDENQADILGAKYLYRTGYAPAGMANAMERFKEQEKRNPMKIEQFLMTHPPTDDRIKHINDWIPRIEKEDVWGGTPPRTNLRNKERYQRMTAAHAVYTGNDEIRSTIENFRTAWVRRQVDLAEKTLAAGFRDDQGRDKGQYLTALEQIFSRVTSVSYRVTNLQSEPRRDGGVARYDYVLSYRDRQSNQVREERGRAYLDLVKSDSQVWCISTIRMVPN